MWPQTRERGGRAISLPYKRLLDSGPARGYLPPDDLRGAVEAAGLSPGQPALCYCNGGVASTAVSSQSLLRSARTNHNCSSTVRRQQSRPPSQSQSVTGSGGQVLFALWRLGAPLDALANYDGSWGEWGNAVETQSFPVHEGPDPGRWSSDTS